MFCEIVALDLPLISGMVLKSARGFPMRYALAGLCMALSSATYAQILHDPNAPIALSGYYEALFSLPSGPSTCGHLRIKAQLLTTPILAKGEASFEDIVMATEAVKAYRECATERAFP
jgi:hypothetical protein